MVADKNIGIFAPAKGLAFSAELELLITSIKVVWGNLEPAEFRKKLDDKTIDWKEVARLLEYHQIIPLFYYTCRQASFSNAVVEGYAARARLQAIKNKVYQKELVRLLHLLENKGIRAVPYKGILFLKEFYRDSPVREMSDMDILVDEPDAEKALMILLEDGYKFSLGFQSTLQEVRDIVQHTASREISLSREGAGGIILHIDFHWHISEAVQYSLDVSGMIRETQTVSWDGDMVHVPTSSSMFLMMLNHHAGRDCWVRLKYLVDLMYFLRKEQELNLATLHQVAGSAKMGRSFSYGLYFINQLFGTSYACNEGIHDATIARVVKMWEDGRFWTHIVPKIRLARINRRMQDDPTPWSTVLRRQVEYHAKSGRNQTQRVIDFPEKYVYLNALSKLAGYLLKAIRRH